jgi:cholest-4-en-3-one 26-monooxygenase
MTTQDVDLMDPKVFLNGIPYEHFRMLRGHEGLPLGHDTDGSPFWYVMRHRDVVTVSRDPKTFSSSPSTMTSVRRDDSGYPIITFLDAPRHTRLRKLVFKAFAPARMAALREPIGEIVDDLIAAAVAKREFDLAEDIALRLPFEVLARLLGVPDDERRMVIDWATQTVNLGDPEYAQAEANAPDVFRLLLEYFEDLAKRRMKDPTDDLFSILANARLSEANAKLGPGQLTLEEIKTFATTLITAGSETTYCSVTGAVLALLENPDQLGLLLTDRSLLSGATDEILRWVTPVTHFARNVMADTEISGHPVKAGERVVMWYTSANRDEEVFTDPDEFDVTRSPNPHLSFGGGGPHVCIGNALAVMELRVFVEKVLDLLPRMRLTAEPVRPETNFMNSFKHMPVRLI